MCFYICKDSSFLSINMLTIFFIFFEKEMEDLVITIRIYMEK